MYTQILKEILLTIDFDQKHIDEFLTQCREQLADNKLELNNVEKLRKEYRLYEPIWWYTYECFLYSMLNRALRLMEVDLIIKMGFFIRDLHNHIATLYSEQYKGKNHSDSFIVYRGQGLSQTDFEQLQATQGGLLSFNNFLSTSQNRDVSLEFARRTMITSNLVGVLFILKIDPSIVATPFANIENIGCYSEEKEILFSMHSIFRIRQVKQIDNNDRLWQVELTLTSENDPQLHALTEHMREETSSDYHGWHRLGKLMITLEQFNKAEELYNILLEQTSNEHEKGFLFYQLGWIKDNQGNYAEAIAFYKKSLEIDKETLSENPSDLATSYNNIGLVYNNMGKHSEALSYYEKALEIYQKTLPINNRNLAASYNNIGSVYDIIGEYSQALSYYEKALEIFEKTLPANHPHLANSYNNIGLVYNSMGVYSKALSYYGKALEIQQKTLPENHASLATSYNNIAGLYYSMNEYSKAKSYFEKALEIFQKTPTNHPQDLASSYNNIGYVYYQMGEYSKALSSFERALDIKQRSLPANHPSIEEMKDKIENIKKRL
jgi:tetratricopeptide (TPR) repeat protein